VTKDIVVEGKGAWLELLMRGADPKIAARLRRLRALVVWCGLGTLMCGALLKLLLDEYISSLKRHDNYTISQLDQLGTACLVIFALLAIGLVLSLLFLAKMLRKHALSPRRP